MKKILLLLLILNLFLGCSTDDKTKCEPIYYYKQNFSFELIDENTGTDLLKSGAITMSELSMVKSSNNESVDIVEQINMQDESHSIMILLPPGSDSFSFQLKRNGNNLFAVSFNLALKKTNDCTYAQAVENFNVTNYSYSIVNGSYKIYL
jgi:hypothetical protein